MLKRMKASLMAGALTVATVAASPARADEYDTLRLRVVTMSTGGTAYDPLDPALAPKISAITAEASGYQSTMITGSGRTRLWSDLALGSTSANLAVSYVRLRAMALAWATTGSTLQGNASLLASIIDGLEWLEANHYNPTKYAAASDPRDPYDNWFDWQIGIPLELNETVCLIYNQLTAQQRADYMAAVGFFTPAPTKTGANRAWTSYVVAVRGIVSKDSGVIASGRDGLGDPSGDVFDIDTSGDGFYPDGSFVQHDYFPYTGGYGVALLETVAQQLYVLGGSTWAVTDPAVANVWTWVKTSFAPLIHKGGMMDSVRGRAISRYNGQSHMIGNRTIATVIRLAKVAPTEESSRFRSLVEYWLQQDSMNDFESDAVTGIESVVDSREILADPNVIPAGEPHFYRVYNSMDRAVQARVGYSVGIAAYSNRKQNFETINSENKRAWHTADGHLYLYNQDADQHDNDYWPTIDAHRMPGTTAIYGGATSANRSSKSWVGGVSISQAYGTFGMDLAPSYTSAGRTLSGRKSWFLFDDEVVALGSNITGGDTDTGATSVIETTVENRRLNASASNVLTVNGTAQSSSLGTLSFGSVNWAHLAGTASGASVGYYFPTATPMTALRETRTAKWSTLNTYSKSLEPGDPNHTNSFLSLSINHGAESVAGANYAYVLLPGRTTSAVSTYAATPDVTVISNTSAVQAVRENKLKIVGANFWTDTVQTADLITVDKRAAVVTKENTGEDIEVAIVDPTQGGSGTGPINVVIARAAQLQPLWADAGITVTQTSPDIRFTATTAGLKGGALRAKFALAPASGDMLIDDTSPAMTYSADWKHDVDFSYYNSSKTVTAQKNGFARLSFSGTKVAIFGKKLGSGGKFEVWIDGVYTALVDTYRSPELFRAKLWETTTLSSGSHTIEIRPNGQKNGSSSGYSIGIDYLTYG